MNLPKFGLASDLHLDFGNINPEFFDWRGDYLLLAGDIAEDDHFTSLIFTDFWDKVSQMASKVFIVCGNHEFYSSELDEAKNHIREFLDKNYPNIYLLNNTTVALADDLVLFGGTMWTNYNNNPLSMWEAQQNMNDFNYIRLKNKNYRKINPHDIVHEHMLTKNALQKALTDYPNSHFIVMTHHAPSHQSIHPLYRNYGLNDAYCNQFDQWISQEKQIINWVHGHVHSFFDYTIDQCQILCNPRGYPQERPQHLPPYQPVTFYPNLENIYTLSQSPKGLKK